MSVNPRLLFVLALAAAVLAPPARPLLGQVSPGRIVTSSGVAFGGLIAFNLDGSNGYNLTANTFDNESGGGPRNKTDHATVSQNGIVAFTSNRDGSYRIYRVNIDGTGLQQLTTSETAPAHPGSGQRADDVQPVIAPDGSKVAFLSRRTSYPLELAYWDIYLVNIDGSGLRRLTLWSPTAQHHTTRAIAWSPDGSRLALRGNRGNPFIGVLSTIDVATGEETVLAGDGDCGGGSILDWASTGDILYSYGGGVQGCPVQTASFIIYNKRGINVEQLGVVSGHSGAARFSPDGSRIVYHEIVNNQPGYLASISVEGTDKIRHFEYNSGGNPLWWMPGPAIPAPASFTITPNPLRLFIGGPAVQLSTLLKDAAGNTIVNAATRWETDGRFIDLSNTGLARAKEGQQPKTQQLCASNGGIRGCIVAELLLPTVTPSPASLKFSATKDGQGGELRAVTPPQTVTVAFDGATGAWTASADQPWVQISSGSGTGTGRFTVGIVNPNNVLGASTNVTANITLTAAGVTNSPQTIAVQLTVSQTAASTAPFGQLETPAQNASGIVGAIGVTGWAMDDLGVASVRIFRNCLPFEPAANCQTAGGHSVVFVGEAAFLSGARPDVEAAFPNNPQAYRAGWGYLMMTSMLPHVTAQQAYGGVGPLTLYAFATDVEGNVTLLGRSQSDHTPTAITLANDAIAKPFGAIDTPGQGETVSGIVNNFGWALTPDSNATGGESGDILIPTNGTTMFVFIDGQPVAPIAYNQCRGTVGNPPAATVFCNDDVANIFGNLAPQAALSARSGNPTRYRNLDAGRAAIGAYQIDTTKLANGLHTIAWSVTDSAGRTEGIGSRFFTVLNSASDLEVAAREIQARTPVVHGRLAEHARPGQDALAYRTGFDLTAPFAALRPGDDGIYRVGLPALDRLELRLRGAEAAYLLVGGELRDLPAGASLKAGRLAWVLPAGYVGDYDLVVLRAGEESRVRITVRP